MPRLFSIRTLFLGLLVFLVPMASPAQVSVGVSVRVGPPELPVYEQPPCPIEGYIWTPGYWAYGPDGYYWVPGTWVIAPTPGFLWTPGYWGWGGGVYVWHAGYWGPHVGFYGGINYGFGYGGVGFVGGEWRGRSFYYNRSVTNVSVTNVTNVYNRTVVVSNRSTTSFNGGTGGVQARPTHQEEEYGRERHTAALDVQRQHEHAAAGYRENFASQNHGRPAIAATSRPGDFSRRAAVPARAAGGEYHAPAMSPKEARVNAPAGNHGNSNAGNRMNTGNSNGNNNKARSNEGFRPFTPPAKNNAVNGRSNENFNRNQGSTNNHGNQSRYNDSRPPQQRHEAAPPRQAPRPAPQRSSPPPQHHAPPPAPHHGKGF